MSASDLPKPIGYMWAGCFYRVSETHPFHREEGAPVFARGDVIDYGDKRAREAVEALQRLAKSFPTDIDMKEAGWEQAEIDEACAAYDQAYRLLAAAPTPGDKT